MTYLKEHNQKLMKKIFKNQIKLARVLKQLQELIELSLLYIKI